MTFVWNAASVPGCVLPRVPWRGNAGRRHEARRRDRLHAAVGERRGLPRRRNGRGLRRRSERRLPPRERRALPCATCHDPHGNDNRYHINTTVNGVSGIIRRVRQPGSRRSVSACHTGTVAQWHAPVRRVPQQQRGPRRGSSGRVPAHAERCRATASRAMRTARRSTTTRSTRAPSRATARRAGRGGCRTSRARSRRSLSGVGEERGFWGITQECRVPVEPP